MVWTRSKKERLSTRRPWRLAETVSVPLAKRSVPLAMQNEQNAQKSNRSVQSDGRLKRWRGL